MLVDEIAFVREKMDVESDIRKKVYYYSAVHAMVQRVLNIDPNFDRQLVFPPENFFDRISTYLQELEGKVRNNEDTYIILEKIAVSAYLLDGNGYYLYQKGWMKLPE
jgi:hypothetical protein